MPRLLRYIAYLMLFVVSFIVFIYWSFPYGVIKERFVGVIEQQVGEGLDVSVDKLKPYWFTGFEMEGLAIAKPSSGGSTPLLKVRKVRARAGLFSLIFGSPRVSFEVEVGKGEISGAVRQSDEILNVDVDFNDVDLKDVMLVAERTGLSFLSDIDGDIRLAVDKRRPIRSDGEVDLDFGNLRLAASNVNLGELTMPLPDLVLAQRGGSGIKAKMSRGTVTIEGFKLAGGDISVDLNGKIFLSTKVDNYRFNINGSFSASEKLSEALPFLYLVEKQKREDGTYPLSITGRLVRPSVKIGTFTLPL